MTILCRDLTALVAGVVLAGCAGLSTRFPQQIASSFARDDMRKLETPSLEVYYSASDRETALRVASRLEQCIESLRGMAVSRTPRRRAVVYLTRAEFNNAYVQPLGFGLPEQMVVPEHVTLEFFNLLGLGSGEVGDISCHEAVHYVQLQQTDGFWRELNWLAGSVYSPNTATESWFLEGLAVHYEGRLGKAVGRTHSPIWRGMFESGVATRALNPGDLSPENRDQIPFGGNYLIGMEFVEFLARRYGDEKLWALIDDQGHSIFSPFGVTLRFKSVYGKSIGALFDEFDQDVRAQIAPRMRPPGQRVIDRDLGYFARIASSPLEGAIASVTAQRDDVVRLTIRERDGTVRLSRRLTQILPERRWISFSPLTVSGLSFTADGRWLFIASVDVAKDSSSSTRLWQFDAHTGDPVRSWEDLSGLGGGVSPDGRYYVYVEMRGDTANLARLDLSTNRRELLTHFAGGQSMGAPSFSPDGARIAFSQWTGEGFDLFVRDESGCIAQLTRDGAFNYAPRWLDPGRIVFLRERSGRVQAHLLDLSTGVVAPITDAPYVAIDAVPLGEDEIAFVNRDGWAWTLDAASLPSLATTLESPAGPPRDLSGPEMKHGVSPPPYPVTLLSDKPYSAADHLFFPTLHAPFALLYQDSTHRWNLFASLSLSGSDRLGFHNYAANLIYDAVRSTEPSFDLGYGNYRFAPWFIAATGGRSVSGTVTDLSAVLSASRIFWTTPLTFFLEGVDRYNDATRRRVRISGPGASISYLGAETTPYAGIIRGLRTTLRAIYFPLGLGSSYQFADLRGELGVYVPLPLLRRHSFFVGVRGRALPGAPDPQLLRVGGITSGYSLLSGSLQSNSAGPYLELPIGFSEFLRGYEDFIVYGTRVAILSGRYRYPLIVDRGSASLLYLLPSFFVRQLDLEAFGELARADDPRGLHRAAGLAAFFRFTLGQAVPITVYYQFSARFDDGLGPLHVIGLSFN